MEKVLEKLQAKLKDCQLLYDDYTDSYNRDMRFLYAGKIQALESAIEIVRASYPTQADSTIPWYMQSALRD